MACWLQLMFVGIAFGQSCGYQPVLESDDIDRRALVGPCSKLFLGLRILKLCEFGCETDRTLSLWNAMPG